MMAEPTQFGFDLREAAIALIKLQGLHEGKWMLGFEFDFAAGNFGPTVADARPGAAVAIRRVLLSRPAEGFPDLPFIVDAAEVNPATPAETKKRK
jgi:hypothetical protein